jgi:hypothetical protein
MVEMSNEYKNLVARRKSPFGTTRVRLEDNIKSDL